MSSHYRANVGRRAMLLASLSILCGACGSDTQRTSSHDTSTPSFAARAITISNVYIVAPAGDAPAAMYFTVRNAATSPDTMTAIHVEGVADAAFHETMVAGVSSSHASHDMHGMSGMSSMTMQATPNVAIQGNTELRFAPGGRHVMLTGIQHRLTPGGTLGADLSFAKTGTVHIRSRIIDYSQVDSLIPRVPAP